MPAGRRVLAIGLITVSATLVVGGGAVESAGARVAQVFRGAGIFLPYPSGLYVTNRPLAWTGDPAQRFVLSTYPVPGGRATAGGNDTPPPTGVIAELVEDVPPPTHAFQAPPRPRHFALPKLSDHLETFGDRWREIVFSDHGRDFSIMIGAGKRASASTVAFVLRTLDALSIGVAPPSVTRA